MVFAMIHNRFTGLLLSCSLVGIIIDGSATEQEIKDNDITSWDFDVEMHQAEQKARMKACFAVVYHHIEADPEGFKFVAAEFETQGMPEHQVKTRFHNAWTMECYGSIRSEQVQKVLGQEELLTEQEVASLFGIGVTRRPQGSPSERQWKILELVSKETYQWHQKQEDLQKRLEDLSQISGDKVAKTLVGVGGKSFIYLSAVFLAIFGGGAILVVHLSRGRVEPTTSRRKGDKKLGRKTQ